MVVKLAHMLAWLEALQHTYIEHRQQLTDLDAAIGDADHGINMERGFKAVWVELSANPPSGISTALKTTAMVLLRTVGGASGPLYGSFFLRASAAVGTKRALASDDVAAMFDAGLAGIAQRGKAAPNDKTMLDALGPAVAAMRTAVAAGATMTEMLELAADAAERGMQATKPMQARKGRASYLGERSIGHQDPGATSMYLLLRDAARTWGGGEAA
jgi:phosphoenolpyruvate---glycerone phosphotransferase subunit DhaL